MVKEGDVLSYAGGVKVGMPLCLLASGNGGEGDGLRVVVHVIKLR